jgi:hypothetical protein
MKDRLKGTLPAQFSHSPMNFIFMMVTLVIFISIIMPVMFSVMNSTKSNEPAVIPNDGTKPAQKNNGNFSFLKDIFDRFDTPIVWLLIFATIIGTAGLYAIGGGWHPLRHRHYYDEVEEESKPKKTRPVIPEKEVDEADFGKQQHYTLFNKDTTKKPEKTHWDIFKKK